MQRSEEECRNEGHSQNRRPRFRGKASNAPSGSCSLVDSWLPVAFHGHFRCRPVARGVHAIAPGKRLYDKALEEKSRLAKGAILLISTPPPELDTPATPKID